MKNKTEILAPVADLEMCRAAIHGGANAIYLGAPYFNARGRTPDLDSEQLKQIIDECHLYGLQVFFALNILIFEKELESLPEYLVDLVDLGADAFIIQDIGLVKLIRQFLPDFPIHASTQMTISSPEAIHLLRDLKIQRFVLAREMSLDEIRSLKSQCEEEIEVFVHGALCVSYSGQCLTSESFGGRSANRGQCAQSCRLDYELWVDGSPKETSGRKYLFSPKDLCGLADVQALVDIGVESLKIEGRLKEPEYVAAAARQYSIAAQKGKSTTNNRHFLELSFSRGFHSGWLHGVDHQNLVDGRVSSHVGQSLGTVYKQKDSKIWIQGDFKLLAGDGIWLHSAILDQDLGGRVYGVQKDGAGFWVDLGKAQQLPKLLNFKAYRNDAPSVEKEIRQLWKDRSQHRKVPIQIEAEGRGDGPLVLKVSTTDGTKVRVVSTIKLEWATQKPLSEEQLKEELGALGDSPYRLHKLSYQIQEWTFIKNKDLRELKRQMIDMLNTARTTRKAYTPLLDEIRFPEVQVRNQESELHLLVRHEEQIQFLRGLPLTRVTMDFEWGKDYKKGLEQIRALGFKAGIASLRIHKPGENHHLKLIDNLQPDFVLVRNLGALQWFQDKGIELIGDHGLNVCNSLSFEYFMSKKLNSLLPSHDLNAHQLTDLLAKVGGAQVEIPLHHYMPTFHMEHCVFAGFLSKGHSFKDCGKPCEKHQVEVRDHKGAAHFLRADQECRNTLFNGTPQSSAALFQSNMLKDFGVFRYRIELLDEDRESIRSKILSYYELIQGRISSTELFERIGVLEKYGVAEGQLFQNLKWTDRKKSAKMT